MKVKALIDKLKPMPVDMPVLVQGYNEFNLKSGYAVPTIETFQEWTIIGLSRKGLKNQ